MYNVLWSHIKEFWLRSTGKWYTSIMYVIRVHIIHGQRTEELLRYIKNGLELHCKSHFTSPSNVAALTISIIQTLSKELKRSIFVQTSDRILSDDRLLCSKILPFFIQL